MRKLKSAPVVATALVAAFATVVSVAQPASAYSTGGAAPARLHAPVPAPTDVSVPLALQQFKFADMAVDGKHSRLYFTDGAKILVTNFAGGVVASIPEAGAGKMTLSPDDGELFVTTGTSGDTIVQINTRTLTPSRSFTVDSTYSTLALAVSDDHLWYIADVASSCTYSMCKSGGVGSFDLGSTASTGTFALNPDRYAPVTVTAAAGVLVIGYENYAGSAADINVYHPCDGKLVSSASTTVEMSTGLRLAITPDGKRLTGNDRESWTLPNLTSPVKYVTELGADTSALSADGTVAYGYNDIISDDEGTIGVQTFAPTVGKPALQNVVLQNNNDPFSGYLVDLAFSPDGRSLFAVTNDSEATGTTPAYTLHILSEPELASTNILATGYYALSGQPEIINGTIESALPIRPGTVLRVTRSQGNQPNPNGAPVPNVVVGQNNTFTIKDTPQALGAYWYTISFAGDSQHLSDTSFATIGVILPTKLTLVSPAKDVAGKSIKITGAVTNGPFGQFVTYYVYVVRVDAAHPNGVAVRTIGLPEDGFFSFTDTPTVVGKNTYEVRFDGQRSIPSATATTTVTVTSAP